MRKLFALVLVLTLVMCLFAGCNNTPANSDSGGDSSVAEDSGTADEGSETSEPADDGEESPATEGQTTIVFWTWFTEQLQGLISDFETANPDIKVEGLTIPSDELHQKLLACITSGTGAPDVTGMQGFEIQHFIAFGGLADLTDKVGDRIEDFPKFKMDNNTGPDGKLYGLPMDVGPSAMYCNDKLFEQAGVDPDSLTTYDEWLAAGEKFDAIGVKLHRLNAAGDWEMLRQWTCQQDVDWYAEDGVTPNLNTPEFLNAVKLQKALFDSGYALDAEEWTAPYADMVMGDKVATILDAAWYCNVFTHSFQEARGWSIHYLPKFPTGSRTTFRGGAELSIPEQTQHFEEAWKLVEYYTCTLDGRYAVMVSNGELPAYLPCFEDERFKNHTMQFFGEQKVFEFFGELLPDVPSWRMPASFSEIQNQIVKELLPDMLSGKLTPEEYVEQTDAKAKAAAENY